MKIAFTITARMKSKRLPLKVLRLINGRPMISHLIERISKTDGIDDVILCTSTNPQDEVLIDYANKEGIKSFRGSEQDVLKRLYDAAKKFDIDFIISTTADNPLTDPIYAKKIIDAYRNTNADFITALDLPLGFFSYGVKVSAIEKIIKSKDKENTEIWGHYFYKSDEFKKETISIEEVLKKPYRLTVDTPEDFHLIREVYENLEQKDKIFSIYDVIDFLDKNPKIAEINQEVKQFVNEEKEKIRKDGY